MEQRQRISGKLPIELEWVLETYHEGLSSAWITRVRHLHLVGTSEMQVPASQIVDALFATIRKEQVALVADQAPDVKQISRKWEAQRQYSSQTTISFRVDRS